MCMPTPRCVTCQIKNHSILKNCSDDVLEDISDKKVCISVQRGERLLSEGEEAKHVYCIRSGVAKVEVQKNGKALILRLESKGALISNRLLGQKGNQPLTITALEPMQLCQLNAEQFRMLSQKNPSLRTEMIKSLVTEIQNAEQRALSLVYNTVRERVAAVLLHIAEIYHYTQDGCSIHVQLDRQDIAELAGTTKEQVSLALAELRQAKLVNFKAKHFKYFDLVGLKKIAETA